MEKATPSVGVKIFEILWVKYLHLVHPDPFKFQFNVLMKYKIDVYFIDSSTHNCTFCHT